jgi:hypothetical protein
MERLKSNLENLNSMLKDLDIMLKKLELARNNPTKYDANDVKAYQNSVINSSCDLQQTYAIAQNKTYNL